MIGILFYMPLCINFTRECSVSVVMDQWHRLALLGPAYSGPQSVSNTKICCEFFQTKFCCFATR